MAKKRSRSDHAFERLLRRLALEEWPGGSVLPPTRILERQLHVSHATVLGVLHRAAEEGLLTVEPRRPVVVNGDAVSRAREILASLSRGTETRRLAYLVPEPGWHLRQSFFISELLSLVQSACADEDIEVETVKWPVLDQLAWSWRLAEGDFSAAFAVASGVEFMMSLQTLQQQRFPVIIFNCQIPGLSLPSVSFDEYDGARKLAATLADLGHRNMSLYSWAFDLRLKTEKHRIMGWLDYLTENDLIRHCSMPVVYRLPQEGLFREARPLLKSLGNPTALAFAYGPMCERFVAVPEHADFRIPQELSVAAFGPLPPPPKDDAWCPAVTTIDFDLHRVADTVCQMAVAMMAGDRSVDPVMLPVHINVTDSIGPPRTDELVVPGGWE
jgi:DNA-binding LacI/PurR family transcriptional regulator